jgi:Zn-dependent M28 family amino/carboxypeptidase
MKKMLFLIPVCCLPFVHVQAQDIKEKEVERIVATLSADDMQGRKTFAPGNARAASFIEKEFTRIGLQPLPGNHSYRQAFHMYNLMPLEQQAVVNGKSAPVIMLGSEAAVHWDQSMHIPVEHIKASDNFYDRIFRLQRNGRKAIVWVDTTHREMFNNYAASLKGGSNEKDSSAAIILVLTPDTNITRWEVKANQQATPLSLCNLGGMIRGSSKPDEYVIFSAHYDHIGILSPENGDSIANGADDDASGVSAVLNLAEYYKHQPAPARSILFITFTGEEDGGYGAAYFAKHFNPEKVVAMFNIDMLGKQSKFGPNSVFITGFDRSDFGTILQKNLKDAEFKVYPDPYPSEHLFYRADNAELARLGVPAHTLSTAKIDVDSLYHNVGDELKTLDLPNLTKIIEGIAISARSIIAGEDTPKRVDKKKM